MVDALMSPTGYAVTIGEFYGDLKYARFSGSSGEDGKVLFVSTTVAGIGVGGVFFSPSRVQLVRMC